jgi:hypothetical protein
MFFVFVGVMPLALKWPIELLLTKEKYIIGSALLPREHELLLNWKPSPAPRIGITLLRVLRRRCTRPAATCGMIRRRHDMGAVTSGRLLEKHGIMNARSAA